MKILALKDCKVTCTSKNLVIQKSNSYTKIPHSAAISIDISNYYSSYLHSIQYILNISILGNTTLTLLSSESSLTIQTHYNQLISFLESCDESSILD